MERKRASDTSRKPDFLGSVYLICLRGAFMAGEIEKAMKFMKHYSGTRLLGNHVPYPVEAWPEGGQRHLSAEADSMDVLSQKAFSVFVPPDPFFHPDSSPTTRMGIYVPSENQSL